MEKEYANKISLEDFSLICRTCLNKEGLKPLEKIPFLDLLNTLTDIQIDDELPKNICYKCINKLEEVSSFITASKNSDHYLKQIVGISKTESVHKKEESEQSDSYCDIVDHDISEVCNELPEKVDTEKTKSSESVEEKCCTTRKRQKSKCSNKAQPIICTVCGVNFSTKKQLQEHQKKNVCCQMKQFNCNDCDKSFNSKFRLNLHMRTHTKETPYECKICLKKFRQAPNLKRHVDILHKGLKPFKCEVCGKEFSRLVAKNEHVYTHTGQKPYVCSYCGETFGTYTNHFAHTYLHRINNGEIRGTTIVARKSETSNQLLVECTVCNKTFSSPRAIFQHTHAKDASQKEFLCTECGKAFLRKSQLQTHSLLHSGEKPFVCKYCGKQFRHASGYKNHVLLHTGEKPYCCNTCQKSFVQSEHLKQHMKVHTGERPYKCSFCEKDFAQKCNLVVHERIHTGETPYFCSICEKGFYDSTRMKKHEKGHSKQAKKRVDFATFLRITEHLRIHTGERPHMCSYCGEGFKKYSTRYAHEMRHKVKNGEIPKSDKNPKKYPRKKPSDPAELQCDICNKTFSSKQAMLVHKQIHLGEKPFLCTVCGKGFIRKSHLDVHLRIHTGERPYECGECGKRFRQAACFRNHLLIHKGERAFKCKVCQRTFVQIGHLQSHLKTHTGEKPYRCTFCGKEFAQNGNLKAHTRIHTGERPYRCVICYLGFHDSPGLKKHLKSHKVKAEDSAVNNYRATKNQE